MKKVRAASPWRDLAFERVKSRFKALFKKWPSWIRRCCFHGFLPPEGDLTTKLTMYNNSQACKHNKKTKFWFSLKLVNPRILQNKNMSLVWPWGFYMVPMSFIGSRPLGIPWKQWLQQVLKKFTVDPKNLACENFLATRLYYQWSVVACSVKYALMDSRSIHISG